MEDDVEIEQSSLTTKIERDGMVVRVCVYRVKGSGDGWTLEVVDHEGGSTVWDDTFESEQEAVEQAVMTIDREGIGCFLRRPGEKLN